MPGRTLRTALSTLLAGVFLLSLGAEAFGWHECPHHHRRAGTGAGAQGGVASAGTPADALAESLWLDGGTDSPPHPSENGPCTCVGNCHGAAASPLPAVLPGALAAGEEVVRVPLRPDTRRQALRLGAYFLPYPNGPPPA